MIFMNLDLFRDYEVFYIDQTGLSQPLPFTLNQAGFLLQLDHQPSCLLVGAVQGFHNFFKREDNIDSVLLIQPVVFVGQTHTVQQDAIQNLCIRGQIFELGVCKQCLGYAVE